MNKRPDPMLVVRSLQIHAHTESGADFDPADTGRVWIIDSYPYAQVHALKLAEIALILDQPLTAVATVDTIHTVVTRLVDLETKMNALVRSATTRTMSVAAPLGHKTPDKKEGTGK